MVHCVRTDSDNADFIKLVKELDADLSIRDGDDHAFYSQYNKMASIKHVIVFYKNKMPVGCGALKEFNSQAMEVKRMYVIPAERSRGIASEILKELERWTCELHYPTCVLETGLKQPEAIALYKKNGYNVIPNYGQYAAVSNSVCFEKRFL